ncbi:LysR family transcriptional regulator [Variovorax sp. RA8]|uniref:LysR family transcriptional regulator n=1 Tax=Variovorax sp. (strain JCM 16519 / RA8) TaxID=662548 RepID=UPI000AC6C2A1|nr:LysR family transcriptional regulator [Variovorax sp. RA8]VTU35246.1 CysJI operon transcriptional activator [Variovorax sp. RA8]
MVKKALLGQVSDSEIRLLRIFKAVVDCGGLAAAELELNIGRSTISRHIKDLEERLALILCRRGRAGFALTPDGKRVYAGAVEVLGAIESFRTDVQEMHAELTGTLSIGLFDKTVSNPQARIGEAIRGFRRQAPDVMLDVMVGTLGDIETGVIDGRLHAGVIPAHRESESLNYLPLFDETMYLYCGRQHPLWDVRHEDLDWSELQDYDYAGLGFHSPNMEASHRFALRRKATVSDQEAIATLVLSGCYLGFLPDHYARTFVADGSIKRVAHPECTYTVRFVAISRRSQSEGRLASTFLEVLARSHADQLLRAREA